MVNTIGVALREAAVKMMRLAGRGQSGVGWEVESAILAILLSTYDDHHHG